MKQHYLQILYWSTFVAHNRDLLVSVLYWVHGLYPSNTSTAKPIFRGCQTVMEYIKQPITPVIFPSFFKFNKSWVLFCSRLYFKGAIATKLYMRTVVQV